MSHTAEGPLMPADQVRVSRRTRVRVSRMTRVRVSRMTLEAE